MSLLTGYSAGTNDEYYYSPGHYDEGHYPVSMADHRVQYYSEWAYAKPEHYHRGGYSPDRTNGYSMSPYSPYKISSGYESDAGADFSSRSTDYVQTEYITTTESYTNEMGIVVPRVRVVKRRNTANKKERRRTLSINTAFSDLRDSIPNVPSDTKLSKIKTLRLATSYISYLSHILDTADDGTPTLAPTGFRADLTRPPRGNRSQQAAMLREEMAKAGTPCTKQDQVSEVGSSDNLRQFDPAKTLNMGDTRTKSIEGAQKVLYKFPKALRLLRPRLGTMRP